MKNRVIILFITILFVILISAAFFPSVISNSVIYTGVKIGIAGVLLLLAFLTNPRLSLSNKLISRIWVVTFLFAFEVFILRLLGFNVGWGDVTSLMVVFIIMCLGYGCNIQENDMEIVIIVFGVSSIILGVYSMYYYVGAITLGDYMYAVEAKNMIGQIVASSGVGLLVISFSNKNRFLIKVSLLVFSLVLLFVLRCRTALLAFLVFGFCYYMRASQTKYKLFFILMFLILLPFILAPLMSFMETVFVGRRDILDLDDLSSGRMERNIAAIAFFMEHPLMGELVTASDIPNIHNYLLHRLVNYGLFVIPLFVVFFRLLFYNMRNWFRLNVRKSGCVGIWMMFIPLFCSMLEPSAPFGPGLVQAMPFFVLGYSMGFVDRNSSDQ